MSQRTTQPVVRRAAAADAASCQAIYAHYVRETPISLEEEPPTVEEMQARIDGVLATHDWLVLVDDDLVRGYAYGSTYRARAAYRWACEVTVYLEPGRGGSGWGRLLYETLFPHLADRGYRTALAAMTVPNPASVGLHRSLGFEDVGTMRGVGWKLGSWHDVLWMQRDLVRDAASAGGAPAELR